MLIAKNIQQILSQLVGGDSIKVPFDDAEIVVRAIDDASKLSLTALVYEGGNYIPPSVRRSLSHNSLIFRSSILTYLTIDEEKYQIKLHYLGQAHLNQDDLKEILEEFGWIAQKWRVYLDDHDKNDLIYSKGKIGLSSFAFCGKSINLIGLF